MKTAIILDNSPGYVGIAPVVHDWLTDRGPESGKFLIVMSLDEQDLKACDRAIDALHTLYKDKWRTSRLLSDSNNDGSEIEISEAHETFFMRLATLQKDIPANDDPLAFYRTSVNDEKSKSGQRFCEYPKEYIGAVVNRVPRAVKDGRLIYEWTPEGRMLNQLLGVGDRKPEWSKRMISYDEYIENQFLLFGLKRGRLYHRNRVHHYLIETLEMAERELREIDHEGEVQIHLSEIDHEHYDRLKERLVRANEILTRARLAIDDAGLSYLARLIHDEWLPGSIVLDFRSAFSRLLRESDLPYFEMAPYEFDTDLKTPNISEFVHRFRKQVLMELRHSPIYEKVDVDKKTTDVLAGVLSGLVSLSLTSTLWRTPLKQELPKLFALVLAIELLHWSRKGEGRSKKLGVQLFLAQEHVTSGKIDREMEIFMLQGLFRRITDRWSSFASFYKVCTTAQARLIDFVADSRFLLQLIRFIVKRELEKESIFPFVRTIAENVIINKTVSHEEAPKKLGKALETTRYFREFDVVLNEILEEWRVVNE